METPLVYELRKPLQIEPNKTYPAVFIFHGMGSNEQNMLSVAEGLEEQFYIFSVRGDLVQPPGFAYFTIQEFGKPHREVFDRAIDQLTGFIDSATEHYPLDKKNLYLLGFSQGAIASMTLGLKMEGRIKGIVALSGYIPGFVKEEYSNEKVDQLTLFISHGEFDNILPYEWGVASNEFFKELGAKVDFQTYPEGHTVSPENQEDFKRWIFNQLEPLDEIRK